MLSSETLHRLLALCLGSIVFCAQSQVVQNSWTLVHRESGISYYLDTGAVGAEGPYRSYWVLVTFQYDPQFEGVRPFKSARLLRYAKCAAREQDTKSIFQYHTSMGEGEPAWAVTLDDVDLTMEPVEPGSVGARIMEMACSPKAPINLPR